MTDELYTKLSWLTAPPGDFRARCKELANSAAANGRDVMRLANHALDENQLRQLTSAIETARTRELALEPLIPFRLGIVGNSTLDPLLPALVASASRHGVLLECVIADFGQLLQEALSPSSRINTSKPDAVLLALDYRGLPLEPAVGDDETSAKMVEDSLGFVRALRDGFRSNAGAPCIIQTIAPPPETLFGSLESRIAGTWRHLTTQFNAGLLKSIAGTEDVLLDVLALAETVGLPNWYSPMQWNLAKFPFDAKMLPLYADHAARLLAAMRGKSRKCLILDLDNTVWGGVIGDDGIEGIVIGQGDATGEAYLGIQRAALALRDRGVVLAVSSKNDDAIARAVFRNHTEMLLREDHIAVFQANWNDKATNIAAIARELSLGIDAMVFLDDNPVERALVREALPDVAVPELPNGPALYARTLAAAGYFEAVAFSQEDRSRAAFYQGNARRASLAQQVGDLDSYLASLKMQISFRPFDSVGRARIAQLINKTNQFNLTTHRYTDVDVAAMEGNSSFFTLQVRLTDAFGDNGMISVVICRKTSAQEWEIDTWLMSCRVLGRRVEQMVLREMLAQARTSGAERLFGSYIPTERNAMVADLYEKLGFSFVSRSADGTTAWEIHTDVEIEPAAMEVSRSGYEVSTV